MWGEAIRCVGIRIPTRRVAARRVWLCVPTWGLAVRHVGNVIPAWGGAIRCAGDSILTRGEAGRGLEIGDGLLEIANWRRRMRASKTRRRGDAPTEGRNHFPTSFFIGGAIGSTRGFSYVSRFFRLATLHPQSWPRELSAEMGGTLAAISKLHKTTQRVRELVAV